MKLKNLRKKIGRIEARMQEDSKKLAKLKRRLDATAAAKARKAQKKAAARAVARQTAEPLRPVQKEERRQPAGPQAKKAKRKLNLSPERRAALAEAMRARWAAKRAATKPTVQDTMTGQASVLVHLPHSL